MTQDQSYVIHDARLDPERFILDGIEALTHR